MIGVMDWKSGSFGIATSEGEKTVDRQSGAPEIRPSDHPVKLSGTFCNDCPRLTEITVRDLPKPVTNPTCGDAGSHKTQERSSKAMLEFVRHTLSLAEGVDGQVALLDRFQWIAGKWAAALLLSAPFVATVVLTKRIRWFDMGERTNTGQHHHAWIVFDYQRARGMPPSLYFAE